MTRRPDHRGTGRAAPGGGADGLGPSPEEIFTAVTAEVRRLLDADLTAMVRYDADATVTIVASWSATGEDPATDPRTARGGERKQSGVRDRPADAPGRLLSDLPFALGPAKTKSNKNGKSGPPLAREVR
jgi:hypothetical protein